MELLDTNIAATIVYPPDMPTPGYEEENKTKVCIFTFYLNLKNNIACNRKSYTRTWRYCRTVNYGWPVDRCC